MSYSAEISYDEMPYDGIALRSTHPDSLATLAVLFGMQPAPVERCRVLELGCATGINLLAMAAALPQSHFTGVDLSPRQIEIARARQQNLGLTNVTFQALDLREIGDDFGEFDYIVAYGIFSWVPTEVQERILNICRRHLAPQGVVLISYNTYPGWHLRGMIREMMGFHSKHFSEPQTRVDQARGLLNFLVNATEKIGEQLPAVALHHQLLRYENEILKQSPDHYLAHEHLEGSNEPLYLYQFVERAARHQLQYLGDVRYSTMLATALPPEIATILDSITPSAIALEQYLDFIFCRTFRQSLLVREELELQRRLAPELADHFSIASRLEPAPGDEGAGELRRYRLPDRGTVISVRSPLSIAAIEHLIAIWPQSVPFAELVTIARTAVGEEFSRAGENGETVDHVQILRELIMRGALVDVVELHTYTPHFVLTPGARPVASPVARMQAVDKASVANLRHEMVDLEPASAQLLPALDGTNDRDALVTLLEQMANQGWLVNKMSTESDADPQARRAALTRLLDDMLKTLARAALLVA